MGLSRYNAIRKIKSRTNSSAFTIVELLIVVVVIAILAAISIVAYNGITNQAKDSAMTSSLQQAAKKVVASYIQNGDSYPADLAALGIADSGDTSYQYFSNATGYCITMTKGDGVSHVAGTQGGVGSVVPNTPCLGHTGGTTVTSDSLGCPTGFIAVPGNSLLDQQSFCIMKYEAKNNGSNIAVSQAAGTPWASISQTAAITSAQTACAGCRLVTESQWMTIAANVASVDSNWSGGTVGAGYLYNGHNDSSPPNALPASTDDSDGYSGTGQTSGLQRRTLMLSNGEVVWDLAGNVHEWTQGVISGRQAGLDADSSDPGTYSWKQWNIIQSINLNMLPPTSTPGYLSSLPALANINNYTSYNGLGILYSNQNQVDTRGYIRGGHWATSSGTTGVFSLFLSYPPSGSISSFGFRATL